MKRIYSIDLFKLLFAYLVAFSHFGTKVLPSAGVSVQLFFIISGFFLGKKYYSKSHGRSPVIYNQWNYTLDHVKSLYHHYIFSLVMLFAYILAKDLGMQLHQINVEKIGGCLKKLYSLIPEILLLQNTGSFAGGINYPLWQVCVLIISGYFVYGLLCFNEKLSRELLFPAGILMIQTLLSTGVDRWGSVGFFHLPILRAISPMCIGVLTYYFTLTPYYDLVKKKKVLFNVSSILAFITLFVYDSYQNIFLITFVIFFLALYDGDSWLNKVFNRKIFSQCGNFSYAIYLNHVFVMYFLKDIVFPKISRWGLFVVTDTRKNLMFFVALTIYSMVTLSFVNSVKKRGKCR